MVRPHAWRTAAACCPRYAARLLSSAAPATPAAASVPRSSTPTNHDLITRYSQSPTRTVTFADLMMYGNPPLDEQTLLQSAERTRSELMAGLARRVRISVYCKRVYTRLTPSALQVSQHLSLPFLPATNPSLAKVHSLYSSAFSLLSEIPEVTSLADNDKLCAAVAQMVEEHRDNIPLLAKGARERPT